MKNKFTKSEKIYHNLSKNLNRISLRKNQKKHFFENHQKCGQIFIHIWRLWTFFNPHIESVDVF